MAAIVLVALLGGGALTPSATLGAGPSRAGEFVLGVDEDAGKWGGAEQTASIARALGLGAIRITVPWRAGSVRLTSADRAALDAALSDTYGLRVVLAVFGRADEAPTTASGRSAYCSYVADLLHTYPRVSDVVIWNEVNDSAFWRPQFLPGGKSAAPAAYTALLARCWSLLHSVRSDVNVITSTSPHGNDAPRARSPSHSPGRWYRLLGAAYKASGRDEPIFDTVGHNPYPEYAAERPWTRHPKSTSIGQGDYEKLASALEKGFRGTGQPLPGQKLVSIWYLEQGFQSQVAPAKAHLYAGRETDTTALPSWSSAAASDAKTGSAPDQGTQLVDAIRLAYCEPTVGAYFNFGLADERDLRGWQSGVLWADWTAKPAFAALQSVAHEIEDDAVDCASVAERGFASPHEASGAPGSTSPISGLHARSRSAFAATVEWSTSIPTASRVAFGVAGNDPTLWSDEGETGFQHEVTLSGLSPETTYRVLVRAPTLDGRTYEDAVLVTTGELPMRVTPSIERSPPALRLDGQPTFPLIVWGACARDTRENIEAGIDLFAENACGDLDELVDELGGRAFSAAVAGDDLEAGGPGLLGYFYPDEADARGMTGSTLPPPPAGLEDGVSLLTLTHHFYSGSAPLPSGKRMYPSLIAASDIVGFDLYPLQEFCRPDRIGEVFDAQRELTLLAPRKPTFQWIESAVMKCADALSAVTPETVRAEAWLAIAGGARGLGFFPAAWSPVVGAAISDVAGDIVRLGPALLGTPVHASWDPPTQLRVGGRHLHGATYVVAVNAGRSSVRGRIRVPGLGDRALDVLDERRKVVATGSSFADTFAPLAVHVYIAPPLE